jgi:hypothetical protein
MGHAQRLWAAAALGGTLLVTSLGLVFADDRSGARSTDAVVKEWVDEFEEIAGKKPTLAGKERQLELIKGMEFGPCVTANRFLSDLMKSRKTPGDQRLYALRCLLRMADEKTFGKLLGVLSKAKDPTLWNVFGRELLVRPSGAIREWAKGPAIKSRDPLMLCAFLRARTRKPDAEQAESIEKLFAKHAKEKGNADIAFHALKALVRLAPTTYSEQLEQAATHADWRLRLAAADILPSLQPFEGDVEAAVRALIQDDSPVVQRAAIEGAGRHRRTTLTNLLIGTLGSDAARTRQVAVRALEAMTGQKFGHDAAAWARWHAKEDPGAPNTIESPRYHGIEVHSDDVVFVVDASSSMTWPWEMEPHRIDVALAELKNTLGKLEPGTRFNVMVFAEDQVSWKKTSMPATPENTATAGAWATAAMAEPAGDTFLHEAIQAALENHPTCDTIFLLTDGNPTAGEYWTPDGISASVREWDRYRRTAIHTVGLSLRNLDLGRPNLAEKPAVMKRILSEIASATSGEFREILDAP